MCNIRVTNKGLDFRDDCTEFVKPIFLHIRGTLEDKTGLFLCLGCWGRPTPTAKLRV